MCNDLPYLRRVGYIKDAVKASVTPSGGGSSSSLLSDKMKFGLSGVIPALVFPLLTVAISIVGYAVKKK